jgi:hypothetical protein
MGTGANLGLLPLQLLDSHTAPHKTPGSVQNSPKYVWQSVIARGRAYRPPVVITVCAMAAAVVHSA